MKHILLTGLWILISSMSMTAQSVVVGILNFNRYDFAPNEKFHVYYQYKYYPLEIDNINAAAIVKMLNFYGVSSDSLIAVEAYGSSTDNIVEILFAYRGVIPKETLEVGISITNGGLYVFGDVSQNKILINNVMHLSTDVVYKTIWDISKDYPIRSFMVKPFVMPFIAFNILSRGVVNGVLADMRNINNSYRLVDYFKELNWQIIHYKDAAGNYKTIRRPVNGW